MNNYQKQIIETINSANSEIKIAVSWFTDEIILNHLINNAHKLDISVLLSADEINFLRHKQFRALINKGARVRKLGSPSALDGNFMHSKFIIIDQLYAYGGSYNFTNNARSNFESFKKWDYSELKQTILDYNIWISESVDFFSGVDNAEEIVTRLQEMFLKEKRSNASILEKIRGIDFNEDELVQKWECKNDEPNQIQSINDPIFEQKIRTTAKSLSNGALGVGVNGVINSNRGVVNVKPHSFYGGRNIINSIRRKTKRHYSLLNFQKYYIEKSYCFLKASIVNDVLVINGDFQPTDDTERYNIRIEYIPEYSPKVFVKSPINGKNDEIHIYREGNLCLFDPSETKYKSNQKLSEYTIPWIVEWIMYYELWKLSGKWEGKAAIH